MWEIESISLADACLITLPAFGDERGTFIKTFHDTTLKQAGIDFTLRESYFSSSKKDVIRGMHFQTPPHHHAKIVFCPYGAILDVIVDLRKGSPTYGQHFAHELSEANHKAYYIPEGFAHGFQCLTDNCELLYHHTEFYKPDAEAGIKYDDPKINIDWPLPITIISERDLKHPYLNDNFKGI